MCLVNVKMPSIVGMSTLISSKNSIIGLAEPETKLIFMIFLYLKAFKFLFSAELSMNYFL